VEVKALLTNCTYLEDSEVTVKGIRIYGSPWQPEFCDWAFNMICGDECKKIWKLIPRGIDVLLTHGPPYGHGDKTFSGVRTGCEELLHTIQRTKPAVHIFGHIHEGYGISQDNGVYFINASICTLKYQPTQLPIVFDVK